MKKIFKTWMILVLLLSFVSCFAEEPCLTVENCEELAAILSPEYSEDDRFESFAEDNMGKTVQIDGFIYDISGGNWCDIEVCAGNYQDAGDYNFYAIFCFEDVTAEDLGFSGSEMPSFIEYGHDVRIVGTIVEYDSFDGIVLEPISIEERNSRAEGLDANAYVSLQKGSKGDNVKVLQQRLIDLHYLNDEADGSYGGKTEAAVAEFQSACGLDATGVADSTTQALLYSDDAPEASLSISCSTVSIGSDSKTSWSVDGQSFTLKGDQTRTIETQWGTYKFDAFGNYEQIK